MKDYDKKYPAILQGLYELGLGVCRSFSRNQIRVYGLDFKIDVGFYTKYIKDRICSNPIIDELKFFSI